MEPRCMFLLIFLNNFMFFLYIISLFLKISKVGNNKKVPWLPKYLRIESKPLIVAFKFLHALSTV